MRSPRPVILLEFNELTPALMDRFIAEGELPNFRRFRDSSEVFVSNAEEEEPYLEPWIQWVTVHTGVAYSEHGVFRLSESHKLHHKNVWDLISDAGHCVWVCGSMNARHGNDTRGYVLPDPWSTDVAPQPTDLLPYFRFVQKNVQEYTRDKVPLSKSDYLQFVRFMLGHGLSAESVASILWELVAEKTTGKGRWRRAFLMEKLQFDLFCAVYRRLKPSFSTFFLNSTAHMQHRYWRYMQPDLFSAPLNREKQLEYESAILEGYRAMDRLLGRMLKLAENEAVVILSTALGQQPCMRFEESGGKKGYRPRDFDALLDFAGVTKTRRVAPVMAEHFWVHLDSVSDAVDAQMRLAALKVGEEPAVSTKRDEGSLFTSCCIKHTIPEDALLRIENSDRSQPFFDVFYELEGLKSGMHHPDGILWIRHPERAPTVREQKVPLLAVVPTILELQGIQKPEYMKGVSLLSNPTGRSPASQDAVLERS